MVAKALGETGRPNRKCCTTGVGVREIATVRVGVAPVVAEIVGVAVDVGSRVGVWVAVGEKVAVDVGVSVAVGVGDLASAATRIGCATMPITMIEPIMQPSATPTTNATVNSKRVRGLSVTRRDYSTKGVIRNLFRSDSTRAGLAPFPAQTRRNKRILAVFGLSI